MPKRYFICSSCGERAECLSEEPPCEMLSGWLTVSQWKGLGSVEHHNFCSFTCLKRWAEDQAPQVPKVYLESFRDEEV